VDIGISRVSNATPRGRKSPTRQVGAKTINLALQGGGAHGAFTWGVLDRLLEDERINIERISATSAGAMNATVLTYGYVRGGREGANPRHDNCSTTKPHPTRSRPILARQTADTRAMWP
jgi:NTE family protein